MLPLLARRVDASTGVVRVSRSCTDCGGDFQNGFRLGGAWLRPQWETLTFAARPVFFFFVVSASASPALGAPVAAQQSTVRQRAPRPGPRPKSVILRIVSSFLGSFCCQQLRHTRARAPTHTHTYRERRRVIECATW